MRRGRCPAVSPGGEGQRAVGWMGKEAAPTGARVLSFLPDSGRRPGQMAVETGCDAGPGAKMG
jgi:hypothetical protein